MQAISNTLDKLNEPVTRRLHEQELKHFKFVCFHFAENQKSTYRRSKIRSNDKERRRHRCVQYQTLRLIISETDVWKERGFVTISEITDINVTR